MFLWDLRDGAETHFDQHSGWFTALCFNSWGASRDRVVRRPDPIVEHQEAKLVATGSPQALIAD